jgi:hypothetical protein
MYFSAVALGAGKLKSNMGSSEDAGKEMSKVEEK